MRIFTLSHSPSAPASSAGPHAAAPSPTRHARTMYNPIPTLIIAVDENDVERCSVAAFRIVAARHTDDILSQIGRWRPAALVVDADWPHLDLVAVCGAAHRIHGAGVLVTMASPQAAPSALHAGCDAILLRPFARNLLAARIGRLARELPAIRNSPADSEASGPVAGGHTCGAASVRQPALSASITPVTGATGTHVCRAKLSGWRGAWSERRLRRVRRAK